MMWVVLAIGLFTELPSHQVFKACRRFATWRTLAGTIDLVHGQAAVGSEPLKPTLHKLVVRPMATAKTIGAFYRGLHKVAIDGTVYWRFPTVKLTNTSVALLAVAAKARSLKCTSALSNWVLILSSPSCMAGGMIRKNARRAAMGFDLEDALLIEDRRLFSYKHWELLHKKHKL
ncbi:MAG: hypothetical protein R3C59_07770 [Planctomycetaceae bacterium]